MRPPDKPPDNDETPGGQPRVSGQHEQTDHSTTEQRGAIKHDYSSFMMKPKSVHRALRRYHKTNAVYDELLYRAAWLGGERMINGVIVNLAAGECVFGRDELAATLGLTPNEVRTAIKRLKSTRIITTRITSNCTREITTEITTPGTIAKLLGYGESADHSSTEAPPKSPEKPPEVSPEKPPEVSPLSISPRSPKEETTRGKERESASLSLWTPSGDVWEFGRSGGLTDEEIAGDLQRFRDTAAAKGRVFEDNDAAARLWLSRFVDRKRTHTKRGPTQIALDELARITMGDFLEAKDHWDRWWTEASGKPADWTSAIEAKLDEKLRAFGLDEVKHRFDCAKNDPPQWPTTRDIDTVLTHFDKFTRGKRAAKWVPEAHRKWDDNAWPEPKDDPLTPRHWLDDDPPPLDPLVEAMFQRGTTTTTTAETAETEYITELPAEARAIVDGE